ncbi:hypothetical protein ACWGH4_00060 [Streptomyces sp. NPDC054847]
MTWPALIGLAIGTTTAVLVYLDQHRPRTTTPPSPTDGEPPS